MDAKYDTIGINYSDLRKPDRRIEAILHAALGNSETVLNVGAGTGSYEPTDRNVTAVEPSSQMIRQRPAGAARVHQAYAEELPFADNSFDAAMTVLSVHHWSDPQKGLTEMRRVARGPVVILTYDPAFRGFWLTDYLPELIAIDEPRMPALEKYRDWLGEVTISPVPVPHDCSDGFLCAYWRRPAAYLDPRLRQAISCFWSMENVEDKLARLAVDLETGRWEENYGDLLTMDVLDCGYRLVEA